MKKPAISIIIPVYNMERYLKECLESIRTQTFNDWECLIVNDGSFDTSTTIIREATRNDSRFKVINKENGGLSTARNVAIKMASGDYIGFVDSDDWIEPTMYEHLYRLITENDADLAQVSYWKEYVGSSQLAESSDSGRIISGLTAMTEMGYGQLSHYVWNKLHRKEIITSDFPIGRNFEDVHVYGNWLKNVNRMVIDGTPLYHYRMRRGSINHAVVAKNRYDYFLSCIDKMGMVQDSLTEGIDIDRRDAYLNKEATKACTYIAREEKNSMKRDGAIARISSEINCYSLPSIKYLGTKGWWFAKILRSNPKLFSIFMQLSNIFNKSNQRANSNFYV